MSLDGDYIGSLGFFNSYYNDDGEIEEMSHGVSVENDSATFTLPELSTVAEELDASEALEGANGWSVLVQDEDGNMVSVGVYSPGASVTLNLSDCGYYTEYGDEGATYLIAIQACISSDSPNTGDDFNAAPYVAVVVVSGAVAAVSAVLTYRKKKPAAKAK